MISIWVVVLLVWTHCFADFVLQTDQMALNKSKSSYWLAMHVLAYSCCMLPFGGWFALVNFCLHFATDFVSSRITSKLWAAGKRHEFFVVIGIDQALHMTALVVTYVLIGGW